MDEDKITPAINVDEEMPNEMSAEEFQRKLYSWFEDRGLLSELRAHLRKQMIGILKDTAIGRTVTSQQKQTISPKVQALNLLIAEFLLHQDYHYTLSVFSTEVPLINVIPEFPGLTVNDSLNKKECLKKWQFSEKDMWDILETLGIQRHTDDAQNIYAAYYKTINKEALLTCIIRMLHSMQNKPRLKETEKLSTTELDDVWMKNVNEILISRGLDTQSSQQIIKILSTIIQAENKRLNDDARENYWKLKTVIEERISQKHEDQRRKLEELQKSLEFEKAKLQSEKQRQEMEVKNSESRIQRHQKILRDRYHNLLQRERNVEEKEAQIQQKQQFLQAKQSQLQSSLYSLRREQDSITQIREKLEQEKIKTAQSDAEFLMNLEEECKDMKGQITNTQETVLNFSMNKLIEDDNKQSKGTREQNTEETLSRVLINQLQSENSGLKTLNSKQELRIQELSERAAILIRELENTRTARSSTNVNVDVLPLAGPTSSRNRHQNGTNSFGAGGEEGSNFAAPAPREYRNLSTDGRKKTLPKRLMVHSSSSSDDPSPTNEILREARQRLRKLEQKSEEVDKHYRQFRSQYAEQQHSSFQQCDSFKLFGTTWFPSFDRATNSEQFREREPYDLTVSDSDEDYFVQYHRERSPEGAVVRKRSLIDEQNLPQTSSSIYLDLCKYLKQENNFNLSSNVSRIVSQANPFNYIAESALKQPEGTHNAENNTGKEIKDKDDDKEEGKSSLNQSAGSSGILGMLEAVTSGVSISDVDTSDEKSDLVESKRQ